MPKKQKITKYVAIIYFNATKLLPCSFGFFARAPNPENPEDPLEAVLSPPPPPPGAVFLRKSKRPPPPAVAAGAGAAAAEDAPEKPENAEKALGPSCKKKFI